MMIEDIVLKYIKRHNMLRTGDNILVGVSGGADSVCLLFVLLEIRKQIPFELFVLHINHQLRGKEADEDERFVRQICLEQNLKFAAVCCDVGKLAAEQGISTEEAGRNVRYQLFEQYGEQWKCSKIAVAHHQNDSAETILLNLFRGSGLKGLAGIEPVRGKIIRPLLCIGRQEIEAYLKEQKLAYRTDSSNLHDDYTRNKIRNQILPYASAEINSGSIRHIIQSGNFIREADDYFEKASQKIFKEYAVKKGKVVILSLECMENTEPLIISYVIRKCVRAVRDNLKDISNIHIEEAHRLSHAGTGKRICIPHGIVIEKSYNRLIFRGEEDISNRAGDWLVEIHPPCKIEIDKQGISLDCSIKKYKKNEIIPSKAYTKWFDYDRIDSALQIRYRKTGDYLTINSAGGRKKLKDYFIDQKIEKNRRNDILLIAKGPEIIWVIGYRINEDYKVTEDTKRILEIRINGG